VSGWDREAWEGVILPPGVRKIQELWRRGNPGLKGETWATLTLILLIHFAYLDVGTRQAPRGIQIFISSKWIVARAFAMIWPVAQISTEVAADGCEI
jgi:hypothetical protein